MTDPIRRHVRLAREIAAFHARARRPANGSHEVAGRSNSRNRMLQRIRKLHPWPDAAMHHPDPDYIHALVTVIGLPQPQIASQIGVAERTLKGWIAAGTKHPAPYLAQFVLERMAAAVVGTGP